jgi:hypothetical protein
LFPKSSISFLRILVPKLAREAKVDEKARTYSPWSHVVSLGYSQIAHSLRYAEVDRTMTLTIEWSEQPLCVWVSTVVGCRPL